MQAIQLIGICLHCYYCIILHSDIVDFVKAWSLIVNCSAYISMTYTHPVQRNVKHGGPDDIVAFLGYWPL